MRGLAWVFAALVAGLAFSASVEAQSFGGGGLGLAAADANGDGAITRDEARAARVAVFDRLDADGDGYITDADRAARMQGRRGERAAMMQQAMDTNHDGKVSRMEFLAAPMVGFDRLDANHDGVVDQAELGAARTMWAARRAEAAPAAPATQAK